MIRHTLAKGGEIAGYKGALTSVNVQAAMNINQPMHGVLFKGGRIEASAVTPIALDPKRPMYVETEIGYIIAVDIGTKLRVPRPTSRGVGAPAPRPRANRALAA